MVQNGCFLDVWQVKAILQQVSHFINIEWVSDLWPEDDDDGDRVSDYSFLLLRECVLHDQSRVVWSFDPLIFPSIFHLRVHFIACITTYLLIFVLIFVNNCFNIC